MSGRGGLVVMNPRQALGGLMDVDPKALLTGARDSYLWPALAKAQDAVAFNPYSTTAAQEATRQVTGPPAKYQESVNRVLHGIGQDLPLIAATSPMGGMASAARAGLGGLAGSAVSNTLKERGHGGLSQFLGDTGADTLISMAMAPAVIPMALGREAAETVAEKAAKGGVHQGFDAWRASIWDDVKRGVFHPEEAAPNNLDLLSGKKSTDRLFRAVDDLELENATKSGMFTPIRGDGDLYVTADPDRLAGGAYGAKGGGNIIEFDPVPIHKATGRLIDVDEIAAKEIPLSNVRRIWKWDPDAKDHVLSYERPNPGSGGLAEKGAEGAAKAAVPASDRYRTLEPSDLVDGRTIRDFDNVPNLSSIRSSVDDPVVLGGVREVDISDFTLTGKHYSVAGTKRINELADQISQSGEISPLIVVVDKEGPYILEGATRAEALHKIGAKSFPAVVVLDDIDPDDARLLKGNTK